MHFHAAKIFWCDDLNCVVTTSFRDKAEQPFQSGAQVSTHTRLKSSLTQSVSTYPLVVQNGKPFFRNMLDISQIPIGQKRGWNVSFSYSTQLVCLQEIPIFLGMSFLLSNYTRKSRKRPRSLREEGSEYYYLSDEEHEEHVFRGTNEPEPSVTVQDSTARRSKESSNESSNKQKQQVSRLWRIFLDTVPWF